MRYLKISQYVPGKGEAWMYYELDDRGEIVRYFTLIPMTGEVHRVEKPIVRQLFRAETMQASSEEEFREGWGS